MKRFFSAVISIAILISIAVPVTANAAAPKVEGLKQAETDYTQLNFTWDKVFGENVTYDVQMGTSESSLSTVKTDTDYTDYGVGDLQDGRSYYVRVRAHMNGEYGEWSDVLEVVTAPKQVENLFQTDCTTSSATLAWDAVNGATTYSVIERINDSDKVLATTTSTSCTIKGLNNKTELKSNIYVRPSRENAAKSYSAFVKPEYSWDYQYLDGGSLRLTPKTPAIPKITALYTGINCCDFSYSTVPYATDYEFEAYAAGKKIASGSGNSFSTSPGKFYSFRTRAIAKISATDKAKYSGWSGYKYCGYGLNASAKKVNKKKAIQVQWKKFKGASDYVVYISKNSKGGFKKVTSTKKTVLKIKKIGKKKLQKKKAYYVKVTARKKVGKNVVASTTAQIKVK